MRFRLFCQLLYLLRSSSCSLRLLHALVLVILTKSYGQDAVIKNSANSKNETTMEWNYKEPCAQTTGS